MKNFYGKLHELAINTRLMSIESDDNDFFKKMQRDM